MQRRGGRRPGGPGACCLGAHRTGAGVSRTVTRPGLGCPAPRRHDDAPEGRAQHQPERWPAHRAHPARRAQLGARRRWLGLTALGVLAVSAAGCGHSAPAPAAPAVKTASAGTPQVKVIARCGTARTVANAPVRIEVMRGKVACPEALTIERNYTQAIREGKAPGNGGGGGPVDVSGWKCQGYPTEKVLSTGFASQCVRGGTKILAVLPPPKKS